MKLTITNNGNKEITSICSICPKDKLSVFLDKYKDRLPDNSKINDLIEAWNNLGLSTDTIDLHGCNLPDQSDVHVAPNGHRFT